MLCYDIHIITMQVSPADWEAYVAEIAGDILYEQSPKSLYLVSGVAAMRDRASSYVGMAGWGIGELMPLSAGRIQHNVAEL